MKSRTVYCSIVVLVGLMSATVAHAKTVPLAIVSPAIQSQATNPSYLREMPTVERVKAEIKGTDPLDTAARQIGALLQLRELISDLARARGIFSYTSYTPDETRLFDGYYAAYYSTWQPIDKSLSRPDRSKLSQSYEHYRVDPKFRDELLTKFFSAEFRAAYHKATSKQPSQPDSARPSAADNRPQPSAPASAKPNVSAGTTAAAYLSQGNKYYDARDYTNAIEAYKKAIALKPESIVLARIYLRVGITHIELQQYEKAISALQEALRVEPGNDFASNQLGLAHSYLKQYPSAVTAFQQAIRLKPGEALYHFNLGLTYLATGKLDAAEQVSGRLQKIDQKKAEELGKEILSYKIYQAANPEPTTKSGTPATGPTSGAGRRPSRAGSGASPGQSGSRIPSKTPQPGAAVSPKPSPSAATETEAYDYIVQGDKSRVAKDYAKAIEAYNKSISLRPSIGAYSRLGIIYLEDLNQYPNALAAFQQGIRLKPDDATGRYNLGIAYLRMEQFEAAKDSFQEAVRLDPNTAKYRYNLGLTYVEMGNKEEALQVHHALQKIDQAQAKKLYETINVSYSDPDDPKGNMLLGIMLYDSGARGYANALTAFRRVIVLKPVPEDLSSAHRWIGEIYRDQKKFDKAVASYQQAIRVKPDKASAHFALGLTRLAMGQKNQALQIHRTLLRLDKKLAQELLVEINKSK